MGMRDLWASSTNFTTWDKKVSLPTFVASTFNKPSWLIVAPITPSPTFFSTGIDSPVTIDSSSEDWPSITLPSVGIFSPGLIIIISPTFTCSISTSFSLPSNKIRAVFTSSFKSPLKASEVFPLARTSKYLPKSWKAIIKAATSKNTGTSAKKTIAAVAPKETKTSILA